MSQTLANAADRIARLSLRALGMRRHFVPTRHGSVHVIEAPGSGSLPPVMVIHGLAACATDEVTFVNALRKRCRRVYAVDLPSHGASDAPDDPSVPVGEEMLTEAIAAFAPEPLVLVGNSLGGLAALRVARSIPDRVLGLFLLAPGGAPMTQVEYDAVIGTLGRANLPVLRDYVGRAMVRVPPGYRRLAGRVLKGRLSRPALRAVIEAASPEYLLDAAELAAVRHPVRVLWGTEERILPKHGHAFFAEHLPDGSVEVVLGLGHTPHRQRPRAVLPRIEAFLRELT